MKTVGIVAHSAEGGALCFLTACREGALKLSPHMHPPIVMSAIPMGLSMDAWRQDDYETIGEHLARGVQQVADAGADFYVCPDNTAHIVLERIAKDLPLPGLHIAEVVRQEMTNRGWKRPGLLGTDWTMTGPVYARVLKQDGFEHLVPEEPVRKQLDAAIFDELCQGIFLAETTNLFIRAIDDLRSRGADCVILGCTEIPLVITSENSPLPVLDSTRLLARYAVREALSETPAVVRRGWLTFA